MDGFPESFLLNVWEINRYVAIVEARTLCGCGIIPQSVELFYSAWGVGNLFEMLLISVKNVVWAYPFFLFMCNI